VTLLLVTSMLACAKKMDSLSPEEAKGSMLIQSGQGLLIAVVSSPAHFRARESIRSTWGQDAANWGIDVKFFMGQLPRGPNKEEHESRIRSETDVVEFDDFTESYHNLTAKALDIFDYAYKTGFAGVMKVDDDTYVHIGRLSEFLTNNADWTNLYAGDFNENTYVVTDPKGRWYAFDQYPHEKWPAYANGPGYFLGSKGLKYISNNKMTLPRIRIDDAAAGVWLQDLGLNKVKMPVSFYNFQMNYNAIWYNPVSAEEMPQLHNGDSVILRACTTEKTACLCANNPGVSKEQYSNCWKATSSMGYEDVIPRSN